MNMFTRYVFLLNYPTITIDFTLPMSMSSAFDPYLPSRATTIHFRTIIDIISKRIN